MTDPERHPLLKLVAAAIHRYDQHAGICGSDIPRRHHYGEADAVLALPEVQQLISENAELHRYHDEDRTALTEMRTTITRLRAQRDDLLRQRTEKAEKYSEYIDRAKQAEAALARVRDFADTLDEMGENTARPDDRRLYQAIAADLRTKTATPPAR